MGSRVIPVLPLPRSVPQRLTITSKCRPAAYNFSGRRVSLDLLRENGRETHDEDTSCSPIADDGLAKRKDGPFNGV